jgi:hypothetical protein
MPTVATASKAPVAMMPQTAKKGLAATTSFDDSGQKETGHSNKAATRKHPNLTNERVKRHRTLIPDKLPLSGARPVAWAHLHSEVCIRL